MTEEPLAQSSPVDPPPAAPKRSILQRIIRRIMDHNPCYLLSGFFMLAGVGMISQSIRGDADRIYKVMGLLGVFNLYEVLVILLGLWLARQKSNQLARDAGYLLVLEVLLLVDATLLYNEVGSWQRGITDWICGLGAFLGIIKISVIMRGLGLHLQRSARVLVAIDIVAIYMSPLFWRLLAERSRVTDNTVYAVWWAVGILIACHAIPRRWGVPTGQTWWSRNLLRETWRRMAVGLLIVSLLGHLVSEHWMNSFWPVAYWNLSPILLGLAAWITLSGPIQRQNQPVRFAVNALIGIALFFSLVVPPGMVVPVIGGHGPVFSPLRASMLGGAGVWGALAWHTHLLESMMVSLTSLALALLGHSVTIMIERVGWAGRQVLRLVQYLATLPLGLWGIIAVIFAFVLLGLGAAISHTNHRRQPADVAALEDTGGL